MTRYLVSLALAVAALGAACSGDSADETTTSTAPTATTTTTEAPTTTDAPTTTAGGGSVNIANFTFNPASITVSQGTTVTWTNGDGPSHTSSSDDEGWDSGVLASGDSFEVVFDEPGVFAYHCNIHPSMTGTVTVEG